MPDDGRPTRKGGGYVYIMTNPAMPGHVKIGSTKLTPDERIRRRNILGGKPKTLGPMGRCVIRLWPDEAVSEGLVLAEGVESALAAATRVIHRNTHLRPIWAAGSAGNMQGFPVLAGIEALTLLVDNDQTGRGQQAAKVCAARWADAGREVVLLTPKHLGDFNDVVR